MSRSGRVLPGRERTSGEDEVWPNPHARRKVQFLLEDGALGSRAVQGRDRDVSEEARQLDCLRPNGEGDPVPSRDARDVRAWTDDSVQAPSAAAHGMEQLDDCPWGEAQCRIKILHKVQAEAIHNNGGSEKDHLRYAQFLSDSQNSLTGIYSHRNLSASNMSRRFYTGLGYPIIHTGWTKGLI